MTNPMPTNEKSEKLAEAKKLIEDSKKNAKECSSENCWHTRICEHKFLLMLQPYLEAQDLISRENQRKFDSEIDFGDVQINESTLNDKVEFNETRITSDNIQLLLENQYAKTNDPEKKVLLLMKIAEFIGAKKTTEDSANLPVIYLPARCKECTHRIK